MISGIYAIQNVQTEQVYVGSTIDFKTRWKKHFNDLQRGDHPNKYLQNAWTKHDSEAFKFYILEKVPPEKELLEKKEALWIAATRSSEKPFGYNLINFTTRRGGLKGYKHTPEAIAKIGEASRRQIPRKGTEASHVKLTELQVNQVRTLYAAGKGSQKQLGDYFGVKKQTIACILNGRSWSHLSFEEVDVSDIVLPERKVLKGSESGRSRLTEEDVLKIRELKASGVMQRRIAEKFNISESHVGDIIKRRIWKHI